MRGCPPGAGRGSRARRTGGGRHLVADDGVRCGGSPRHAGWRRVRLDPQRRALRNPDLQARRAPRHLSLQRRTSDFDRARRRARAGAAAESRTEEAGVVSAVFGQELVALDCAERARNCLVDRQTPKNGEKNTARPSLKALRNAFLSSIIATSYHPSTLRQARTSSTRSATIPRAMNPTADAATCPAKRA